MKVLEIIEELEKAKYTKRTGTKGNYTYEYGPSKEKESKKEAFPQKVKDAFKDVIKFASSKDPAEKKKYSDGYQIIMKEGYTISWDKLVNNKTKEVYKLPKEVKKESMRPFEFEGSNITNPFRDETDMIDVDPKKYYPIEKRRYKPEKGTVPENHQEAKDLMSEMGIGNVKWWGKDGMSNGGPDGEWVPDASIETRPYGKTRVSEEEDDRRYEHQKKVMQPKVDSINKKLEAFGFKPTASWDIQEKGYVTLDFSLSSKKRTSDSAPRGFKYEGHKFILESVGEGEDRKYRVSFPDMPGHDEYFDSSVDAMEDGKKIIEGWIDDGILPDKKVKKSFDSFISDQIAKLKY